MKLFKNILWTHTESIFFKLIKNIFIVIKFGGYFL